MKNRDATPFISFLEDNLGPMITATSYQNLTFEVLTFDDRPSADASTYITSGLSMHVLRMGKAKEIRQELLFCCYSRFQACKPSDVLAIVGSDILEKHVGLLRGEVLGPAGPLFRGSKLEALYCASPVYHSDELAVWKGTEPPTILVWLVPITHDEAHFIFEQGWNKFEDLLEAKDPDLLDLKRRSIVP